MKILFITHKFYPDIGGIEVNSEILANAFHERGHEVRLITWTKDIGEKKFPFPVLRAPDNRALLREHRNCDIVFENNPSLRLAWPSVFFRKAHVVALRTWINRVEGNQGWQDKLKLWWLTRATAVIAISEEVRKRCWPKAVVIGNPYRNNLFRILPDTLRTQDFVFMGRLVSDKGADVALKAFKEVLNKGRQFSDLTFTIIGDGPEMPVLLKLVNDLNIEDKVKFTGPLRGEALVECLNKHRYLLVPSTWEEPFGNVALEGLACGCLPIVSDGGGLKDAVGDAGIVVSRNDVHALAEAIASLLVDKERDTKLRALAPAQLKNHYPDIVSERYLQVIERAFKEH